MVTETRIAWTLMHTQLYFKEFQFFQKSESPMPNLQKVGRQEMEGALAAAERMLLSFAALCEELIWNPSLCWLAAIERRSLC